MDIKSLNQAKKLLAEKRTIALEKIDAAKQNLLQNKTYAELVSQIKLNTLAISRALSQNQDTKELEKKDKLLRAKLQKFEDKFFDKNLFFECTKCEDSGIINGKFCDCLIKEYKRILRENSGANELPNFTFEDNNIDKINCKQNANLSKLYASMQKYCEQFPNNSTKNIFIRGKVGIGKSCLLSAILNNMLERGFNCQYYSAFSLGSVFLKYHTTGIKEREHLLENLFNLDLLIIDDLGTEPIMKNVSIEYLTVLLNERVGKHTIISTNLSLEELQNKYGDRVFSRLTNQATTKLLYLDGDDLRHLSK